MRIEAVVGGILMPRYEAWIMGVLGKGRGAKKQDVGSDQRLHGGDDARVPGNIDQPRKRQVRLYLQPLVDFLPRGLLIVLDSTAIFCRLLRTKGAYRRQISLTLEERHLL